MLLGEIAKHCFPLRAVTRERSADEPFRESWWTRIHARFPYIYCVAGIILHIRASNPKFDGTNAGADQRVVGLVPSTESSVVQVYAVDTEAWTTA